MFLFLTTPTPNEILHMEGFYFVCVWLSRRMTQMHLISCYIAFQKKLNFQKQCPVCARVVCLAFFGRNCPPGVIFWHFTGSCLLTRRTFEIRFLHGAFALLCGKFTQISKYPNITQNSKYLRLQMTFDFLFPIWRARSRKASEEFKIEPSFSSYTTCILE